MNTAMFCRLALTSTLTLAIPCGAAAQIEVRRALPDFNGDRYADLAVGADWEDLLSGKLLILDAGAVNVLYGSEDGLASTGDEFLNQSVSRIDDAVEGSDHFGNALTWGDFDDDDFTDLAIGVSFEYDAPYRVGAVHIVYGSDDGLLSANTRSSFWTQHDLSIEGVGDLNETLFGSALTSGDFNCDGFDDLAIGAPNQDVNGWGDAGAAYVLYGGPTGVTLSGAHLLSQRHGDAYLAEYFGYSLAAGDFDDDGCGDLAVGVPDDPIGGEVDVFYGSAGGLTSPYEAWSQDGAIAGSPAAGDSFGSALATGDFDDDGYDDLAVGVPGDDTTFNIPDAGAVNVIYGSSLGLTTAFNTLWSQAGTVADSPERGDGFGSALAAGDFDGDDSDDLAIGVPYEDLEATDDTDAGAVNVLFGSTTVGLTVSGNQLWTQDSMPLGCRICPPYIEETADDGDSFGETLMAADFDLDDHDDLAVGVPKEDIGKLGTVGGVNVIYGSDDGLSFPGNQFWSQGSSGIEDSLQSGDRFGIALAGR